MKNYYVTCNSALLDGTVFYFQIKPHKDNDPEGPEYEYLVQITKTRLYNFDPLKPHFYTVKLGFIRVYIIFSFLFMLENIDCRYSLEPPRRRGGSNEYTQSMFWVEIWKKSEVFIWKFSVFGGENFSIFEYACFRNAKEDVQPLPHRFC